MTDDLDILRGGVGYPVWGRRPQTTDLDPTPRGANGCTCGTPPFAPPEPSVDCPFHGEVA